MNDNQIHKEIYLENAKKLTIAFRAVDHANALIIRFEGINEKYLNINQNLEITPIRLYGFTTLYVTPQYSTEDDSLLGFDVTIRKRGKLQYKAYFSICDCDSEVMVNNIEDKST